MKLKTRCYIQEHFKRVLLLRRACLPQAGAKRGICLVSFRAKRGICFGFIPSPCHYTLKIHEPTWNNSDYFQVEIKSLPSPTTSILIDISPIHPDCTGGHQIIVKTK